MRKARKASAAASIDCEVFLISRCCVLRSTPAARWHHLLFVLLLKPSSCSCSRNRYADAMEVLSSVITCLQFLKRQGKLHRRVPCSHQGVARRRPAAGPAARHLPSLPTPRSPSFGNAIQPKPLKFKKTHSVGLARFMTPFEENTEHKRRGMAAAGLKRRERTGRGVAGVKPQVSRVSQQQKIVTDT